MSSLRIRTGIEGIMRAGRMHYRPFVLTTLDGVENKFEDRHAFASEDEALAKARALAASIRAELAKKGRTE